MRTQDLGFKKGEMLTIDNTSEDPNWWLATNAHGKTGMIPANYVVCTPFHLVVLPSRAALQELTAEAAVAASKSATLPKDTSSFLLVRCHRSVTRLPALHCAHAAHGMVPRQNQPRAGRRAADTA